MFQKITSKSPAAPQTEKPTGSSPAAPAPASAAAPAAPASSPAPAAPAASPSQPAAARPAASSPTGSSSPAQRNILSNDVHIKGKVRFANDLLVDGRIEGEIISDGNLTVAENAHIKAELRTKGVVVYGKLHGDIHVTDRVEIKSSAEVVGDIKAAVLSIEPGAIFVGKSEVGTPSSGPVPTKESGKPKAASPSGTKPASKN